MYLIFIVHGSHSFFNWLIFTFDSCILFNYIIHTSIGRPSNKVDGHFIQGFILFPLLLFTLLVFIVVANLFEMQNVYLKSLL